MTYLHSTLHNDLEQVSSKVKQKVVHAGSRDDDPALYPIRPHTNQGYVFATAEEAMVAYERIAKKKIAKAEADLKHAKEFWGGPAGVLWYRGLYDGLGAQSTEEDRDQTAAMR